MSGAYGFLDSGFNRKRYPEILQSLQDMAEIVFGPDLIQTEATPMGQWHGIYAGALNEVWERLENLSWAFDPSQASGMWLDRLAVLMTGQGRLTGESDEDLRARLLSDSAALGRAQNLTDDLTFKIRSLSDVELVTVWVNETNQTNSIGLPPHSYAIIIVGNPDQQMLADTIWRTHPVGITIHGDIQLDAVGLDGRCHQVHYSPGCKVYISVKVFLRFHNTQCCSNAELELMRQKIVEYGKSLVGKCPGFNIGEQINRHKLFEALSEFSGVEIVDIHIAKRAPQLWAGDPSECEDLATMVMDEQTGELIPWVAQLTDNAECGICAGGVWCEHSDQPVCLEFNEYPDFDQAFVELVMVDGQPCVPIDAGSC